MNTNEISKICYITIQDPEINIGGLNQILSYTKQNCLNLKRLNQSDDKNEIIKFAILSLVEVFIDIIPSYKISKRESENDQKPETLKISQKHRKMNKKISKISKMPKITKNHSKEVTKRRTFEDNLLEIYDTFVKMVVKMARRLKDTKSPSFKVSAFALCRLLDTTWEFNLSDDIASAISILLLKNKDDAISTMAKQSLEKAIKRPGEMALCVAKIMATKIERSGFKAGNAAFEIISSFEMGKSEDGQKWEGMGDAKSLNRRWRLMEEKVSSAQ